MMRTKDRLDVVYEPEQIAAAKDEIKYQLLKLQVQFHSDLTAEESKLVEKCMPEGHESFDQMVKSIKGDLSTAQHSNLHQDRPFWIGTRMEVEMPSKLLRTSDRKSIETELLSQKFFFEEDYHHYDDWKALMESTYDNFNLMQVPKETSKENYKVYFDGNDFNRRIPHGIFPYPSHKRVVMEQS